MYYALFNIDEYYGLLKQFGTSNLDFLKAAYNTKSEKPSDDIVIKFDKTLYHDKGLKHCRGGVMLYSNEFIGLARALLGVYNKYEDIGTCIIGETLYDPPVKIDFKTDSLNTISACEDVALTKFTYEGCNYGLKLLYDSYRECKKKYRNLLDFKKDISYSKCDTWFVFSAMYIENAELLKTMFDDGISAYADDEIVQYILFAILRGNKDVFETILKYEIYTNFTDNLLSTFVLHSHKTSFIIWYRKKYRRMTRHDIPFFRSVFVDESFFSSLKLLWKYIITAPWIP